MTSGQNVVIRVDYSSVLRKLAYVVLQPAEYLADHRRIRRSRPQRQVANVLHPHSEFVIVTSVEVPGLVWQSKPEKVLGVPERSRLECHLPRH